MTTGLTDCPEGSENTLIGPGIGAKTWPAEITAVTPVPNTLRHVWVTRESTVNSASPAVTLYTLNSTTTGYINCLKHMHPWEMSLYLIAGIVKKTTTKKTHHLRLVIDLTVDHPCHLLIKLHYYLTLNHWSLTFFVFYYRTVYFKLTAWTKQPPTYGNDKKPVSELL